MLMKTVERMIQGTVLVLVVTIALLAEGVSLKTSFNKADAEKIKAI